MALNFTDLDAQRDRLEGAHPGWHVWYVPHQGGITWCAQPTPTLNEASVEELEKAIRETEADWQNEGVHGTKQIRGAIGVAEVAWSEAR